MAYIGDAVHTLYVRQFVISKDSTIKKYNFLCSHFCSAVFQSKVYDRLNLNEIELQISKRARNVKTNNVAKNATIEQYKKATSLEAIIGWHYLEKNINRLDEILSLCVEEV